MWEREGKIEFAKDGEIVAGHGQVSCDDGCDDDQLGEVRASRERTVLMGKGNGLGGRDVDDTKEA